jgi:hypothetical protein
LRFVKLHLAIARIVKVQQIQCLTVLEPAMDRQVTQPTKEQVRAYMAARGHAHRPPPTPEDIRRQLGWRLGPPQPAAALLDLCLLPATASQCVAQMVFVWLLLPLRALVPDRVLGHPKCSA